MKDTEEFLQEVMPFQTECLRVIGFLDSRLTGVATAFRVILLIGGIFSFVLYTGVSMYHVAFPIKGIDEAEGSSLVKGIDVVAFSAPCIIGIIILGGVSLKLSSYKKHLKAVVEKVADINKLKPESQLVLLAKWKKFTRNMTILSVSLILLIAATDQSSYIGWETEDMMTFSTGGTLSVYGVPTLLWYEDVLWVICVTIPSFFAHQVFITFIIFAKILDDCCATVQAGLAELQYNQALQTKDNTARLEAAKMVRIVEGQHLSICSLSRSFNKQFGGILFSVFALNILMACGPLVQMTNVFPLAPPRWLFQSASLISAVIYNTVFMLPFVSAHERIMFMCCMCLHSLKLQHLVNRIEHSLRESELVRNTLEGQQLLSELQSLRASARDECVLFSGFDLLHFTRPTVWGTVTLLMSFGVFSAEVIYKPATTPQNCVCNCNCSNTCI